MTIPVTEVTVGLTEVIPITARIINVSDHFAPESWESSTCGNPIIYDAAFNGGDVSFYFTAAYSPDPASAVRHSFGTDLTQFTIPDAWLSTAFGVQTSTNAALDFAPAGFESSWVPPSQLIYDAAYNGGAVDLDFAGAYELPSPLNVPFYFGPGLVVAGVSAGQSPGFGFVDVDSTWTITPASLSAGASMGTAVYTYDSAANGVNVNFDFVAAYTPEPASATQFVFGTGARFLLPSGVEPGWTYASVSTIYNTARQLIAVGIDSLETNPIPRVAYANAHYSVDFVFAAPYAPPSPLNVPFYFSLTNQVYTVGQESSLFGAHSVDLRDKYVTPVSWASSYLGTAAIYGLTSYINDVQVTPLSSRFGDPAVVNRTQVVYLGGIYSTTLFGSTTTIALKAKIVAPTGINSMTFGTQYVADYYQVLPTQGFASSALSSGHWASFYVRYLEPSARVPTSTPSTPWVSRNIVVEPAGWVSSVFGTELTVFRGRPIFGIGMPPTTAVGTPSVRHQYRYVYPAVFVPVVSSLVEVPKIYNLRQYILHINGYDELDWAAYGKPYIENFNKELRPQGWRDSRFAFYPADLRQPYQVKPEGVPPNEFQRPIQIAYRIRYYPLEGWQSSYMDKWHVLYKTARQLYVNGIAPSTTVGRPEEVLNRNRTFRMHWVLDSFESGTHMVAYRIRSVQHWFPYQGSTGGLGADVRINPHPLAPTGWESQQHAAPYVEEKFTIIHPWGVLPKWPPLDKGTVVENRNKELKPGAFLPREWGNQRVEHWIRYVYPQGAVPTNIFGNNVIKDRRLWIEPSGISPPSIVNTHKVEYTSVTLYTTRYLFATGGGPFSAVGTPLFNRVYVYPSGIHSMAFGSPTVRANSIFPRPAQTELYISYNRWGFPSIAGPQWAYPQGWESHADPPKQRVTPHTIWARFDAPTQAVVNHDSRVWELVDPWKIADGWTNIYGQFGVAWVANKNRTIYAQAATLQPSASAPSQGVLELWGTAWVSNWRRYIVTQGRRSSRFGRVDIPTSPRELIHVNGSGPEAFGTAAVQYPQEVGYAPLRPVGFEATQWGDNAIELFNRNVYPAAFTTPSRRGSYVDGLDGIQLDPPVHQLPASLEQPPPIYVTRVGPPVPRQMQGFTNSYPTAALVAYRIRTLYPEGLDSLEMHYQLQAGRDRFRVWKRTPDGSPVLFPPRTISAGTVSSLAVGTPDLYNWRKYVHPSGCFHSSDITAPTVSG